MCSSIVVVPEKDEINLTFISELDFLVFEDSKIVKLWNDKLMIRINWLQAFSIFDNSINCQLTE